MHAVKSVLLRGSVLYPRHDVVAIIYERIERGGTSQNCAACEVNQRCHQGSGSHIQGDSIDMVFRIAIFLQKQDASIVYPREIKSMLVMQ
ncbi:MAG: hypothetical protein HCAMLNBO_01708 [Candidatus Brocadia fulgida]|nr:hypothetical protein [Candidatus Brocadia fulgida]